mgnify:CR=1 FL=1
MEALNRLEMLAADDGRVARHGDDHVGRPHGLQHRHDTVAVRLLDPAERTLPDLPTFSEAGVPDPGAP